MVFRHSHARSTVCLVAAMCLAAGPMLPALRAQATTTAKPPQTTPTTAKPAPTTAKPAASTAKPGAESPDGTWPRTYAAEGGSFVVYQPQIASWDQQKKMVAFAAVSYTAGTAASTAKPALGTVKVEADTKVSVAERLVDFSALKVTETNFPTLKKEQIETIARGITEGFPATSKVIGLDRVLASLDKSQIIPKNIDGVKADPPVIFFSSRPAVLVNLDGEAIWNTVQGTDLKFAVNTNWDLFQHTTSNSYYLRNDQTWLKATDLKGPWGPAGSLPASFTKLPADANWTDVKAAVPGKKLSASNAPTVFVSTVPSELILLKGEPKYEGVPDTQLFWVSNTESDVFRMGKTGAVYYLVAGRWFSAPDFNGPWTFATPTLPDDFKDIPLEHDRSRVLASVPGSQQAAEAVLLASVPQTARVNKKTITPPTVEYDGGQPQFEPIDKTKVSRATNTDKDIIKVGDMYYMCFQGVWFLAKSPTGPWEVTGSVPGEIYEIPVSSPAHNVTYVTVEDDDDEWVVFATAMAYTGVMVAWGCAVWGSGWYYPPYYYGGIYRPYYPTYGYGAYYNPWTGAYGRGFAAYGPYGGAGYAARYNPRTGTYSRGAVAYGPYGARGAAEAYNPRTGGYAQTRQGSNVYGSWGQTSVQRGDQWATTSRVTNNRTGTTSRVTQGSGGGTAISRNPAGAGNAGFIGQTGGGDMYAGRDGNVYRQTGDGWQKYDNGGWNNVNTPNPQNRTGEAGARAGQTGAAQTGVGQTGRTGGTGSTGTANRPSTTGTSSSMGQLDRDARARSEGAQRTSDLGSVRSGSSTARPSSYRPTGGGARAGGGRRGRDLPLPGNLD